VYARRVTRDGSELDDTLATVPGHARAGAAGPTPEPGPTSKAEVESAATIASIPAAPSPAAPPPAGTMVAPGGPRAIAAAIAAPYLPEVSARRYRISDEVGRGGLGRVLRAHDVVLDRSVALKEVLVDDDDARRRFVREALITARLQHPAIVPVYEAGSWPDRAPFYAMKLVAGRPMSDLLAHATTLDARLALIPNVLAACDAVAYAHGERIIHRDLKPHNILVGAHGETVVIDWGLAKDLGADDSEAPAIGSYQAAAADQTAAGAMLGTPAYMAPEQALGQDVDARADVYALGALLYHVVAGVPPHRGANAREAITRIIAGDIEPAARKVPGAPRELCAIIGKAMARAPADRYPTARELADDLRRFTTDQLVGAHRYTLAQRLRRWLRRNGPIVAAVVGLIAFGGWGLWSVRHQREGALEAAHRALALQAAAVEHDVAFSLDQADPLLGRLATLADPALPIGDVAPRMHDLMIGRPGIANLSIGFPSGLMRGTFVADGSREIEVQESEVGEHGTTRRDYRVTPAGVAPIGERTTDYDVRTRPHYRLAEQARARTWTPPRTYFTSRTTGVTCVEPIYGPDGALAAVTTVDFDVAALSAFVAQAPVPDARTLVFAGDGTILAYPSAPAPEAARREDRLLRHQDYADPALEALFTALGAPGAAASAGEPRFLELDTARGRYLAAVAPIGGRRAGITTPLDWYVATLVPANVLLGAADHREQQALIALGSALAIAALGVALAIIRARRSR
jgi:Protein kinase domain